MNPGESDHSPLENLSSYRGEDWSPECLAFHQNLEQFADRVCLIVGLQANGKVGQNEAYAEVKALWNDLCVSKKKFFQSNDSTRCNDSVNSKVNRVIFFL